MITDPNVAYLLMLIGVYGIILEFWSPGFVLPGVIGGISLLLALAALSVLPIDYAGLGLILLGIALMIGEVYTAGTVVLGIGGVVAFAAGSILLFDPSGFAGVDFSLSWPVVASSTATTAAFMLLVAGMALKARKRAVVSGAEHMRGTRGRVVDWQGARGRVRVMGELWNARAAAPLAPGDLIRIAQVDGLTLVVEKDS